MYISTIDKNADVLISRSPSARDKLAQPPQASAPTYYCDGGSYQNIPLIHFLQRRVKNIVLFDSSVVPMQPSDKWDPLTEPFTSDKVHYITQPSYVMSLQYLLMKLSVHLSTP